ncbi:MAG: GMC oxidoreductase [Actinomycetota bacterium]
MILDARELPDGARLEADVAVVGAGPAGITLSGELLGSGLSVLLLEAGGEKGAAELDPFHGEVVDLERHPQLVLYRRRGLGGTSALWGGRCVPFDPIDLEERPHVPWSGWPMDWAELRRWYDKAAAWCEAGPFRFRAGEALAGRPPMVPGLASDQVDIDGLERFSPPTRFGSRYRSMMAAAPDLRVVLSAACVGVDMAESGRAVAGLRMASAPGRGFTVAARHTVLAAGGLETPRLMLASGLGQGRPTLGRFYMCHIEGKAAVARFPDPAKVVFAYERDPKGIYCRRFFAVKAPAQRRLGLTNTILRFEPPVVADPAHGSPVLSALYLVHTLLEPEYGRKVASYNFRAGAEQEVRPSLARHLGNVLGGLPELARFAIDWGWRHSLAARKLPYIALKPRDGAYAVDYNAEQVPNPDSRVMLGEGVDAFGMPRLKVDWRITETDLAGIVGTHRLLAAELAACGAGRLDVDEAAILDGYKAAASHHIGTARMADDPARGVVDRHCRVHGIDNLYLASSAVFPTSSHANPTLTIVALAARLAAHLAQRVRGG